MNPRFHIGVYLAIVVAILDQGTKWWVLNAIMIPPRVVPVTPFLNLVLSWNKGITFGLFNRDHPWMVYVFIGAAVVILAVLLHWMMRATTLMATLGLGLIMGGAIGNVVDRNRFGAVADFIDFHVAGYHWYAFNLADSAIVCGVILLLLEHLATARKKV